MHASLFAPIARGMGLIGTYILMTTLLVVLSARASASLVASVIATKLRAEERVYAGHETQKRTSTPRRIKVVARRTTTNRQQKAIQEAFDDIDQVEIATSIGVVKLISLQEMPMMQMRQFMMTPGDRKMVVLMDILQLCLINPSDWDKISVMPIKEVNRLIKNWMELSDGNSEVYNEEEEDEDDE